MQNYKHTVKSKQPSDQHILPGIMQSFPMYICTIGCPEHFRESSSKKTGPLHDHYTLNDHYTLIYMAKTLILAMIFSGAVAGAIYSHATDVSTQNILSSRRCIYERNTGQSDGGVFRLDGPHLFHSENNTYTQNSADTGSVIQADSENVGLHMVIDGDTISSNKRNVGIFYFGKISTAYINDTDFINNTSDQPTVYMATSVERFICTKCIFMHNSAESEGILNINGAQYIFLHSLSIENNTVDFGTMIKIRKSTNATVTMSHLQDNFCSNEPCFLSIEETVHINIEKCSFINGLNLEHTSLLKGIKQGGVEIRAGNIALKDLVFTAIPGYSYRGTSSGNLNLKNVSYNCPKGYTHRVKVTNTNLNSLHLSQYDLQNETILGLECMQCDVNHYRIGLSSLVFNKISDLNNPDANGICYKCPSGGFCSGTNVIAYPNYWGFVHKERLHFVFCPSDFCCRPGSCISYNGCNQGREGRLCTSCKEGFQLSIVSDQCIVQEKCQREGWIYATIILTGLLNLGFLVIKVEIFNVAQQIHSKIIDCYASSKLQKFASNLKMKSNNGSFEIDLKTHFENDNITLDKNGWIIPFDQVEIFHILVYHFQDTSLFQIKLPDMPHSSLKLDQYKEKVLSLVGLDLIYFADQYACFPTGWTQLNKLLTKTAIIPFMILIMLLSMSIIRITRLKSGLQNRVMSSAYTVFLLIVLFSSQRLSTYALTLINCKWLGIGNYLYIDTTVRCYQPWQIFDYCYIGLFILPFWLTVFLGPGLLAHGKITVRAFLFGLLFPTPFVLYSILLIWKERKKDVHVSCNDITTSAVLNEVWDSFNPFPSSQYLCWGGIVEIRRLSLVFCATLIASSIVSTLCMITVVLLAFAIHVRFHPYADWVANSCANISLGAQVLVGIINFGWAIFQYSGSNFDYGDLEIIGQNLITLENVLIQLFPLGAIVFCIGYFFYANFGQKNII